MAAGGRQRRVYTHCVAIADLLRGPSRSDSGALTAALYKSHGAELLRFAWHRLGRIEDAEDAVQATFLSAHRVLAEGEHVREPRAWLFRILRNECLTRIAMTKRRGVHEPLEEWHADPRASVPEQVEHRDEFDVAVALLGTLPPQQREAMVLREWLGLSAIETADVMETTAQGVDALVYRARKSLVGLVDVADDSTCGEVRLALADDRVTTATRAHLLTCRSCRGAARRLRAPEELAASGFLPFDSLASRLGESIPGFAGAAAVAAVGGGAAVATAATAGGGAATATIASSIAVGTAAKVVIGATISVVVAGGALGGVPAVRRALQPVPPIVQSAPPQQAPVSSTPGRAKVVVPTESVANNEAEPTPVSDVVVAASVAPVDGAASVDGSGPDTPAPVQEVPAVPVEPQSSQGVPERGKPESGKPESDKPQSGKPESGKPESGKPESGKPESGKPESGKPESGKPESGKPESGKPESGKSESGKSESGTPQSGKPDTNRQQKHRPQAGTPNQ